MSAGRAERQEAPRARREPIPDLPVRGERTDDLVRVVPGGEGQALDLSSLFGNDRAVELEIGVGKGRFVLLAATAKPETNFLGVEYARKYLEGAIDRVGKRGLENVRLVHAEAVSLLEERLSEASIDGAHFYFPDPWPKKRHHKRRFFRPGAIDALAGVLRDDATFRSMTDHDDYAEVIREVMGARQDFEPLADEGSLWKLPGMGDYTTLGVTNFEIKYRREGRAFHRFAWRRRPRARCGAA